MGVKFIGVLASYPVLLLSRVLAFASRLLPSALALDFLDCLNCTLGTVYFQDGIFTKVHWVHLCKVYTGHSVHRHAMIMLKCTLVVFRDLFRSCCSQR